MDKMKSELKICESCIMRFKPVVNAIEVILKETDKDPVLVAIDGKCASGKTTLGYYLQQIFDCNLFHMDDFFLQAHQRTKERLEEPGGNVDYERFKAEVLMPLLEKKPVKYRTFNCSLLRIDKEYDISPRRLNIIEGSYSQHPYFENPYDLRVFMDIDTKAQTDNIRKRNGEDGLEIFLNKWIPMENRYFDYFKVRENSQIVIEWKEPR